MRAAVAPNLQWLPQAVIQFFIPRLRRTEGRSTCAWKRRLRLAKGAFSIKYTNFRLGTQ